MKISMTNIGKSISVSVRAFLVFLALTTGISACRSLTSGGIYAVSSAVGAAAGLVVSQIGMSDEAHTVLCEIVKEASSVIPADGKTFEACWSPLARRHVDDLKRAGKLSETEAAIILSAFGVVIDGMDYLRSTHDEVSASLDLVAQAVDGFASGFMAMARSDSTREIVHYDVKAYEFLKSRRH